MLPVSDGDRDILICIHIDAGTGHHRTRGPKAFAFPSALCELELEPRPLRDAHGCDPCAPLALHQQAIGAPGAEFGKVSGKIDIA